MTIHQTIPDIDAAAQDLVKANLESEPLIKRILRFPSNEEIRLIEFDPTVPPIRPGESVAPYYFSRSISVPYPSAIALLRPEEEDKVGLPEGWSWEEKIVMAEG